MGHMPGMRKPASDMNNGHGLSSSNISELGTHLLTMQDAAPFLGAHTVILEQTWTHSSCKWQAACQVHPEHESAEMETETGHLQGWTLVYQRRMH